MRKESNYGTMKKSPRKITREENGDKKSHKTARKQLIK